MLSKDQMRVYWRQRLKTKAKNSFDQAAVELALAIQRLDEYRQCQNLLLYFARETEISTQICIDRALEDQKSLFFPKITSGNNLQFALWQPGWPCKENRFGINEPTSNILWEYSMDALIVVPGLAFSAAGVRLGNGGGYYDRFLENLAQSGRKHCTVGVCLQEQVVPEIEKKPWDRIMDRILFF